MCHSENVAVSLRNATARWILPKCKNPLQRGIRNGGRKPNNDDDTDNELKELRPPTLNRLCVEFPKGNLIGVIGPVGAGKSSLLQAILRELPLESGSINIDGKLAYASQEPWVFAGTIRQNILFGQDYDKERYNAVIKACALSKDFTQFPNGDQTYIGERGTSLSGGQKARVGLARAVYRQADIYLLDDPLSAVDSHVGAHLFHKCLGRKGYLAQLNTTRILVTHQIHFLKDADWLIFLQNVRNPILTCVWW